MTFTRCKSDYVFLLLAEQSLIPVEWKTKPFTDHPFPPCKLKALEGTFQTLSAPGPFVPGAPCTGAAVLPWHSPSVCRQQSAPDPAGLSQGLPLCSRPGPGCSHSCSSPSIQACAPRPLPLLPVWSGRAPPIRPHVATPQAQLEAYSGEDAHQSISE